MAPLRGRITRRRGGGSTPPRELFELDPVSVGPGSVRQAEVARLLHPPQEQQLVDLAERPVRLGDRDARHERGQVCGLVRLHSFHEEVAIGRPGCQAGCRRLGRRRGGDRSRPGRGGHRERRPRVVARRPTRTPCTSTSLPCHGSPCRPCAFPCDARAVVSVTGRRAQVTVGSPADRCFVRRCSARPFGASMTHRSHALWYLRRPPHPIDAERPTRLLRCVSGSSSFASSRRR